MEYRRLGRSGLKVSVLSFGSWVTFGDQMDVGLAAECMAAAHEAGVNFFDNAESYAGGEAESVMGEALERLGWPRHEYVVSSKYFWGIHDSPNTRHTLNRKYLLDAVDGSLERFGLDYLDIIFCHRPDPQTPIAETARAMSDVIDRGKALYWGTSEWSADEIRAAWQLADRHGWHPPIVEQPQYNVLHRTRVEREYRRLFEDIGLGTTTWSPLGGGLLTGKYLAGIPAGSRATVPGYEWLRERYEDAATNDRVRQLAALADELDVPLAHLAIAWCTEHPHVSTVITGASSLAQVEQNMRALDAVSVLTPDVMRRIDGIVGTPDGDDG